jgi:Holliday junction DNA helicase RuvB
VSHEPIRTPGVFAVDPAERIQTAHVRPDDDTEATLRPRRLEEFVGQEALREQLAVSIAAAGRRGEALDHVLLAGPPGLGKTSLAQIVAAELDVPFVQTAGPALERKADIAAFLTALEPRAVFFVDEIHRLPRAVEETFYPAMEDRQLPITVGAGAGARVVTLDLPPFTLVGATTRSGLLTTPLRDRFGIQHRLDHYGPGELATIVARSARVLEIEIEPAGAQAIAERSRGTPRVANRLLKRVRDYAEVRRGGVIDARAAGEALDLLEVDHEGLDRLDREILSVICSRFGGGPVGLSTLAVAVQEEQDTIEDVYEPYLLQRGFLQRTPRGRCATPHAFRHLGLPAPEPTATLFG